MKNININKVNSVTLFNEFLPLFDLYQEKKLSDNEIKTLKKDLFNKHTLITIFTIKDDEKTIGFMLILKSYSTHYLKNILHLQDFFVIEEYRSKGIGTQLFNYLHKYAKDNNIPRIQWVTHKENIKAQKFYNKYKADNNWIFYQMKIN